MAIPLKGKISWWKKCHPRRLWHNTKLTWKAGCSVKEEVAANKYTYLIILAGVVLGCLIAAHVLFWNERLNKYGS